MSTPCQPSAPLSLPSRSPLGCLAPRLLPVLALLLGALGLFAAAPAQAQSQIWSATLTVDDIDDDGAYLGCDRTSCPSQLTEDELEHNGERYTVQNLYYNNGKVSLKLGGIQPDAVTPAPDPGSKFDGMVLHLGTVRLPVGGVVRFSDTGWHNWYVDPQWTDGQQVAVKLEIPAKSPWNWPDGTRHHDKNQIWSTTMAAKALEPTRWGTDSSGCRTGVSGGTCPLAMGANRFTYAGNTYTISDFYHRNGTVFAGLSSGSAAAITAARSLMLIVKYPAGAERRFPLRNLTASGTSATASWPVDDMRWGSYGHPHPTDPQRNPAVWASNFAVTLAVVEVPEPVTVTVTSPAPRTHTVTVSVPTAVAAETIISLGTYGRVGSRVWTDLRDPDLVSHCDPMDPLDPATRAVNENPDRKYPMAYIQAGQRSTTFNLCLLGVPKDVENQIMTNQVTVYLPRGRSSVTYDINVGSAYGGGSGAAEYEGGEGPGSGEEQQGDPLTAVFEDVPEEHDGTEFAFRVRLSETVGSFSRSPRLWSFAVTQGRVTGVEQIGAGLWRVTVRPTSPSDVTVTLAGGRDCDDEPSGAVCTPDGRSLSNTSSARVAAGPQQQQEVLVTPEPADVRVVPGDGSLTVSWTAVAHPRVAAERVQHALRWSQEAGVWANPSGNNGVAVEAGVNGYTITGLRNGVATGVFVRAFVGGLRSERSEHSSGWVRVKGEQTTPRAATQTVAVEFGKVPAEHDGRTAFVLDVQSGSEPAPEAFTVTAGTVTGVEPLDPVLWRVRVAPSSWKDVKIALGAASAKVPGPARIRVADARAKEGKDASLDFAVTLSRAAAHEVSVDYATKDGTAAAGADYTAASGTLTFAPGETAKTVSVALLDDSHDEGKETFTLTLSNPQGAYLRKMHREAKGVIRNDDPLQAMWLSRFGRMVASDAVASVTARLETPRGAGSHVTLMGQRMNFGEAGGGGAALATVLTGFAQTFGAPSAPAADEDDPFARHGLTGGWNDPAAATGARRVTARELLLGTSFRAVLGQGAGSQWTSWGQGASVSQFSAAVPGLGLTGEAATGSMGMDYERGRLLMGFAMTHSVGEGTASDAGWRYALGSTATMMMPYARLALSERISAWGMAGTGSGTHDARPRRRRDAALPHGPRDDARGDRGAGRADSPRRAGRVRAGAEGGRVLGADRVRPGRGIRVRQPRGRARRVEPGAGGAGRLAHLLVRERRGADAVGRARGAPRRGRRGDGDGPRGRGRPRLGGPVARPRHGAEGARPRGACRRGLRRMGRHGAAPAGAGRQRGARPLDVAHAVVRRGPGGLAASVGAAGVVGAGGHQWRGGADEPVRRGGGLRHGAPRRPLHRHAQCRVRAVGDGARVPHGLAADLGGARRPRLRGQPRRDPPRGRQRRRSRARGDAPKPHQVVRGALRARRRRRSAVPAAGTAPCRAEARLAVRPAAAGVGDPVQVAERVQPDDAARAGRIIRRRRIRAAAA